MYANKIYYPFFEFMPPPSKLPFCIIIFLEYELHDSNSLYISATTKFNPNTCLLVIWLLSESNFVYYCGYIRIFSVHTNRYFKYSQFFQIYYLRSNQNKWRRRPILQMIRATTDSVPAKGSGYVPFSHFYVCNNKVANIEGRNISKIPGDAWKISTLFSF